jgi:HSP20 family molecular chaperone IbpA
MEAIPKQQTPPVKVYRSLGLLVVAMPMAGVGPDDIGVEVTADGRLVVEGRLRSDPLEDFGALASTKEVLVDEWMVGPYRRELTLADPVDGPATTLTYGNGVLVVVLPIADRTRATRLTLLPLSATRGERAGSPDHPKHRPITE